MKKSEELFYLIQSLSKSEIRYIKLFLNRKDSILERLFDAIKKQMAHDEKAIKKTFRNEKFINQLTATKYHLRKLILKALRSYEKDQFEIDELLANVQILYEKGLYSICKAELKRADRLAHEQENFPALIRVQEWERKLHLILHPADHSYIKNCINKQHEYASILSNISTLWIENIDVENAPLRKESELEKLSIKERILVYLINYRKYLYQLDYNKALGTLRSIQSLLRENPGYLKKDPQLFINNQNNLSAFLIFRNELDESLKETQTTKAFIDKQKKWNAPLIKSLFRTYNTELEIYRMSNQLDMAKGFIEEVVTYPSFHRNKMPVDYRLSFYFQFAYIYFLDHDYKSAISWLNKVLDHPLRETRSDIMMYSYWLNLIVHTELKNYFILNYFVGATQRYLKKRKKIEPYEKMLLRFFSTISRIPEFDIKSEFRKLNDRWEEKIQLPERVSSYIDFKKWIEGRAE